jgi:hypothetical protein
MLDANREEFISVLSEGGWPDTGVVLEGRRRGRVGESGVGWGIMD